MVDEVRGAEATVRFDGAACTEARICVPGNPKVSVPDARGASIYPDAAPAEAVMRLGFSGPSGAIGVMRNDSGAGSGVPPPVTTVRIRENGPPAIEAELVLKGEPLPHLRAVLSRCGAFPDRPRGDGSHRAAGFTAE